MAYYYSPFRKNYVKKNNKNYCPFCDLDNIKKHIITNKKGIQIENKSYYWFVNFFPKFDGHTMIVPRRHIVSIKDETDKETLDRKKIICFAIKQLKKIYPKCGFEIFLQYGQSSNSSIKHLHWHIAPANMNDELRSFEKLGHFYTTKKNQKKILIFPTKIKTSPEQLINILSQSIGYSVLK
ncbi:MAG: HIT domain-containing protein [Patescibacteria group bacterium]|nr:HIT domain-containing protein [Patescibacteria group bacterium]